MIVKNSDFIILTITFSYPTSLFKSLSPVSILLVFWCVCGTFQFIGVNGMFLDGRFGTDNQYGKENYILRKHR